MKIELNFVMEFSCLVIGPHGYTVMKNSKEMDPIKPATNRYAQSEAVIQTVHQQ